MKKNGYPQKKLKNIFPQIWWIKPFAWLNLVILNLALFASCRQPPLAPEAERSLAANQVKSINLTSLGENDQPAVSQDGKWMVFVSRRRPEHSNAQVYLKDLTTGQESRLTFQNGDTFEPLFLKAPDEIIYASSTDELKENPTFLKTKLKQKSANDDTTPPIFNLQTEVYRHNFRTPQMSRLTSHSGFDGNLRMNSKGELFWTRWLNQQPQSLKSSSLNPQQENVLNLANGAWSLTPSHQDPKKFVYLQSTDSYRTSQIWMTENGKSTELASEIKGLKINPHWSPDDQWILFVLQNPETLRHSIFAQRTDGSCLTQLTAPEQNEKDPLISADGTTLFFAKSIKGRWQILKRPWTGPCPAQAKGIQ